MLLPEDVVINELKVSLDGFIVAYSDTGEKVEEYNYDVHKLRFTTSPEPEELVITPTKSQSKEYVVIRRTNLESRKRAMTHHDTTPNKKVVSNIVVKGRGVVRPSYCYDFLSAIVNEIKMEDLYQFDEYGSSYGGRKMLKGTLFFSSPTECITHMGKMCGWNILHALSKGETVFKCVTESPDFFFE